MYKQKIKFDYTETACVNKLSKAKVRFKGKTLVVTRPVGLKLLAMIDFLDTCCGYVVRFEVRT